MEKVVSNITDDKKLKWSLFSLRAGVFLVFIMWTIDKFVNPSHTAAVFNKFYLIEKIGASTSYLLGGLQLLLVLGFLFGIKKRITYGALLVFHTISTFSTWQMYLNPWGSRNLLFFAAFPMLAAIIALYNLREHDDLFTLKIGA